MGWVRIDQSIYKSYFYLGIINDPSAKDNGYTYQDGRLSYVRPVGDTSLVAFNSAYTGENPAPGKPLRIRFVFEEYESAYDGDYYIPASLLYSKEGSNLEQSRNGAAASGSVVSSYSPASNEFPADVAPYFRGSKVVNGITGGDTKITILIEVWIDEAAQTPSGGGSLRTSKPSIPSSQHPIAGGQLIDKRWWNFLNTLAASDVTKDRVTEVVREVQESTPAPQVKIAGDFPVSVTGNATDGYRVGVSNANLDERAVDAVAAALAAGTSDGVSFTYDDENAAIAATNTDKGSVAVAAHEAILAGSSGAGLIGWNDKTVGDALELDLPYADSIVDLLIVYGQSNALGSAATTSGAPGVIPNIARMWDGAALAQLTAYTPSANGGTSTGCAWAAFGAEYCNSLGRGLVVVNCGRASQSISDLSKGGANYTAMTTFVNNAVAAIAAEGSTLGKVMFAFNQGERDSQLKTTAAVYGAALAQLWADVKADFGASRMGIFTVGYYATADMLWGQLIQQAQRLFARNTEDAFIAYDWLGSFGSHNKLKVDGVHYTQRGYNIMGREGARRFIESTFPDYSAPATDEQIKRFGSLNMGQSQAWNLHAGFFQKSGTEPNWTVNHTSPRASSLVTDIDATSDTYKLNVKLACPARTIMFADARFHGSLGAAGIRAVVHTGLTTTGAWPAPNSDGVTVVPIYFYGEIHLRIDMSAGTMVNTIMGTPLASLKDSISVTFPSTGNVTITHPTCTGYAKASINGTSGRHVRVSGGGTSTSITVKDSADANVNDVIDVTLFNMAIPHADIPVSAELSFAMIAADYAIW